MSKNLPEVAGKTAQERIDEYWGMPKDGFLRLHDPEVDDEDAIVEATTPGQRAHHVGAKLFAIRQIIRRAAQARVRGRLTASPRPREQRERPPGF